MRESAFNVMGHFLFKLKKKNFGLIEREQGSGWN